MLMNALHARCSASALKSREADGRLRLENEPNWPARCLREERARSALGSQSARVVKKSRLESRAVKGAQAPLPRLDAVLLKESLIYPSHPLP